MVAVRRAPLRATARHDERGASAVEFALIAPLVFALLFGSITFGFAFFHMISLNDSVRAGARFGATAVGTSALPADWPASTVRQRTADYSAGTLSIDQVCVALVKGSTVLASSLPTASATTCTLAGQPDNPTGIAATDCLVKVWASQPEDLSAPPLYSTSIMLSRGSVTRYERTC